MSNPFTDKIKPGMDTFINSSMLLTRDDFKQYLIYEETHKVSNPEKYLFFDCQVNFIAFKADTLSNIISLVIYVYDSGTLISSLKQEFGDSYSSFSFTGEMTGFSEQRINYETLAWKIKNRIMLVAAPRITVDADHVQRATLARIWIKNI
jgi:hypothetical protein